MFYGSDQFLTYAMSKPAATEVKPEELPPYLVPQRAGSSRTFTTARCDFLVVTEFTEHVGPEPLVCVIKRLLLNGYRVACVIKGSAHERKPASFINLSPHSQTPTVVCGAYLTLMLLTPQSYIHKPYTQSSMPITQTKMECHLN